MAWNCAKHLRRQKSILITCSQCRQWMIVITKRFCTRSFLGGRRLVMEGCLIKWSFCAWYHAQCLNFHTEHFVSQYVVDHVSQNGVHKTMMVWVYNEHPCNGSKFVCFGMLPIDPAYQEARKQRYWFLTQGAYWVHLEWNMDHLMARFNYWWPLPSWDELQITHRWWKLDVAIQYPEHCVVASTVKSRARWIAI
jgi:hypothetical protein